MIRAPDLKYDLRLRIAKHANTHGIRDAARVFDCARNTVRLWQRRFNEGGKAALVEKSRAPHHCPHKISPAQEKRILQARDQAPFAGARRLKDLFGLRAGIGSIARVLRQNGRTRRRRRKHQRKNDLRKVKRQYRAFERLQADTKPLSDIPAYWAQAKALSLPWHIYTHRDVKTGALFMSFADELSTSHATIESRRVIGRLQRHGHSFEGQILSTDNGSEYGGTDRRRRERGFHAVVESLGIAHRFLPPASPKCHADVESIHATIEQEFFDLESFTSRADFFEKVCAYQRWYNFARPNYSKGNGKTGKTPARMLSDEGIDPRVLLLTPDDLDAHIRHDPKGIHLGQYLPVDPRTPPRRGPGGCAQAPGSPSPGNDPWGKSHSARTAATAASAAVSVRSRRGPSETRVHPASSAALSSASGNPSSGPAAIWQRGGAGFVSAWRRGVAPAFSDRRSRRAPLSPRGMNRPSEASTSISRVAPDCLAAAMTIRRQRSRRLARAGGAPKIVIRATPSSIAFSTIISSRAGCFIHATSR